MDPNKNTGAQADNLEAADAAVVQDAPDDTAGETGLDGALAALDAGLEQAGDAPTDTEGDDAADADAGAQDAPDSQAGQEGAQAGADGDAAKDANGKPAAEQDAGKTAEQEATDLGVKNERARNRFLELRGLADKVPELERKAQELQQRAERGDQIVHAFEDTGAQPQQVTSVLAYLHAVNKGDLSALNNAYEVMEKEMDWLADKLGKPRRGQDVLAGHQDLVEAVEDGMPRAQAEELAALRNSTGAQQRFQQQHTQQTQAQQQDQQRYVEAVEQGKADLNALEARLKAEDPQGYQVRMQAVLSANRARIEKLPPDRWAIETELAFMRTKAPQQDQQQPRRAAIGHVPVRQSGTGGGMGRVAASAEDALELGLAAASRGATA